MWEQIAANRRKSFMLVVATALLLMALGYAFGEYFGGRGYGPYGVAVAAVVWLVMTLFSWFQGDQVMLAVSGAHKVKKEDLPVLFNVVEEMTLAAGLPKMPDVYVIDDPAPNAFATGRRPETAAVAVTSGLLRRLNRDELQGVIAHEIGHIRNRDIQLMLFAGVLAGAIVILAEVGLRGMWFGGGRSRSRRSGGGDSAGIIAVIAVLLAILAPLLARLIYLAISRKREYLADASSAVFTRYPEGLASALEKIASSPQKLAHANRATAPMYIVNPLARAGEMAAKATATHPPIAERIKVLRSMAGADFRSYQESFRQATGKKGVIPPSALKDDGGAGLRPGSAGVAGAAGSSGEAGGIREPQASQRTLARQVDDFFYRKGGYKRIPCTCGTVLKIPPDFKSSQATCPRCGKVHDVA